MACWLSFTLKYLTGDGHTVPAAIYGRLWRLVIQLSMKTAPITQARPPTMTAAQAPSTAAVRVLIFWSCRAGPQVEPWRGQVHSWETRGPREVQGRPARQALVWSGTFLGRI